jgi:hypothetical protein
MSEQNFYIGFATFEEFLASAPKKSIYLSKSVTTLPGEMNTETRIWHVTACAIVECVCHYWRLKLGKSGFICGAPLFPEEEKYQKECEMRSLSAQTELSNVARSYGFSVTHALVSFPKDLVVMTGSAKSLKFNKETNSFERNIVESRVEAEKAAA